MRKIITKKQSELARKLDSELIDYLYTYCPGNSHCDKCQFLAKNMENEKICLIEETAWGMECAYDRYHLQQDTKKFLKENYKNASDKEILKLLLEEMKKIEEIEGEK